MALDRLMVGCSVGRYSPNSTCKSDLDSLLQLRYGVRLNTSRQARAACGVISGRIASTTGKIRGGEFTVPLSRTAPVANAATAQRRITKRVEKHGRWIMQTNKPTCLKRRHALIASTASNVVCRARERAEASDWLRCAERHEKLRTLSERFDSSSRQRTLYGVCCLQPTRTEDSISSI